VSEVECFTRKLCFIRMKISIMTIKRKRVFYFIGFVILGYFLFNSIKIFNYSAEYSESKCDVAIVLGAGTYNGRVSPVFRERINHSIYLYNKGFVEKLIFTGGFGEGQKYSDSQAAKMYALIKGIPDEDIIIEENSRFTIENIRESKRIMDSLGAKTALIISDPLHMMRSMKLAENQNIDCKPSPTKTSMYKSVIPKMKSLVYETFYFSLGELVGNK
jgi:uncharacterized SAM-binding protein YcdF (DUF218 family)